MVGAVEESVLINCDLPALIKERETWILGLTSTIPLEYQRLCNNLAALTLIGFGMVKKCTNVRVQHVTMLLVPGRKEESDKNNDNQTVPSSKTNQLFEESKLKIFQSSSSNSIRYSLILVADQPEITQ